MVIVSQLKKSKRQRIKVHVIGRLEKDLEFSKPGHVQYSEVQASKAFKDPGRVFRIRFHADDLSELKRIVKQLEGKK